MTGVQTCALPILIEAIKIRQPTAKMYIFGLYPRRNQEERLLILNKGIKDMAQTNGVLYADIGTNLLLKTGKIDEKLFSDGLHPNATGYELLGKALVSVLK